MELYHHPSRIVQNLLFFRLLETNSVVQFPWKLKTTQNSGVIFKIFDKSSTPPSLELSFITSLQNCASLRILQLFDNPLNGILPISKGNLSASLEVIYAGRCKIKGTIPGSISNISNLIVLGLGENHLTGSIPMLSKVCGSFKDCISTITLSLEPFLVVFVIYVGWMI